MAVGSRLVDRGGVSVRAVNCWIDLVVETPNRQPQGATLALDQLAQLQRQYAQQPAALLRELSVLLRRVAINQYGRERVSGLTGNAWVEFLDQQAGKPLFAPRFTTLLTEQPYRPDAPVETAALIQAIRTWINLQQGKRHV